MLVVVVRRTGGVVGGRGEGAHTTDIGSADGHNRKALRCFSCARLLRRPDLLCLQECISFPTARTRLPNYTVHAQASSHRGNCLLATRDGSALLVSRGAAAGAVGPCALVAATLHGHPVYLASAHLAPSVEGASERQAQLADITAAVPPGVPLVLAGDMNMRVAEGTAGLVDAWVALGEDAQTRWTWNTRVNRYYLNGHRWVLRGRDATPHGDDTCRPEPAAPTGHRCIQCACMVV